MHVLAIDAGSYSVKYLSSRIERKKVHLLEISEILVRDFMVDHRDLSPEECLHAIIQDIIESVAGPETKIIFQVDQRMMTTRFLTLPVKSKKKAELMLPFQLEEDIPFSMNDIHYSYKLEGHKNQHTALIEIVKNAVFEPFYNPLRDKNILPNVLTTESSVMENYFNLVPMSGAFCILDIGHSTTKAYFFYQSSLLMSHISYMGGLHINDMISENYRIDLEEAINYKHQNAFFLTSTQYSEVGDEQRDFALSMDRVFSVLISDFLRWKIGYKLNLGINLQHLYLCGGTSNIKNITEYLSEKLDIKTSLLETFDRVEADKINFKQKNKLNFSMVNMMAIGFKRKSRFINLLSGRFAQSSQAEFPIHSFAFLGLRVSAITLILAISLMVERFFIEKDITAMNVKLNQVLKNDELGIPGRLKRQAVKSPRPVYDSLVRKQRSVKQEISTIQSSIETKALPPLITVGQLAAANTGVTLVEFKASESGEVTAIFTSESMDELSKLKKSFEQSSLSDVQGNIDTKKLQLTITAMGN